MNRTDIQLIVSDIDGTILNSEHQVTQELKETLEAVTKVSIPFVLTSARSPLAMAHIRDELGLETPLAAYNGAYISEYQTEKELFSLPVDFTEANKVIQLANRRYPEVAINIYAGNRWLVPKRNPWVQLEEEITQMKAEEVELHRFLAEELAIHKVLFIGDQEPLEQLERSIGNLVLLESAQYRSKENYLEFTHKKVSKALALEQVAAYYQVDLAHTLAIGDHDNDVSMIGAAGVGVAMGNASEAARKKADFITADNDHNGVAVVLKQVLQGKQERSE